MRQNLRDHREVSSSGPDDRLDLEDEKEKMLLGLTPDVTRRFWCQLEMENTKRGVILGGKGCVPLGAF